jgi:CubicO group peptidase (beta-lactamase class C family)
MVRLKFIIAVNILFQAFSASVHSQAFIADAGSTLRTPEYLKPFTLYAGEAIRQFMEKRKVPGLSVAITDRNGIIWEASFGVRDTVSRLTVDNETIFGVASVTKPVTATVILKAAQEGILALDIPVTEYMPGLRLLSRFEKHPERKITLRLLLSHRVGMTHEAPLGNNWDGINCSFEDHIESINGTWLRHPVGQRYDYSSSGFDLAAFILQCASGIDYPDCAERLLFTPLGMSRTSVNGNTILSDGNRATGYTIRYHNTPPVFLPYYGGGALYSTANDLARVIQLHLRYGKTGDIRFIDSVRIADMHHIQWPEEGQIEGSGLGINRWHNFNGTYIEPCRMIHTGGGLGFGSVIEWFPQYGIGIVILNNLWEADPTPLADQLLIKIFTDQKIIFEKDRTISDIIVKPDRHKPAERYLGDWGIFNIGMKGQTCFIQWGKNDPRIFRFLSSSSGYYGSGRDEYNILRFFRGKPGQNDYAISMGGGIVYNKVLQEIFPGAGKRRWKAYCGVYDIKRWGETVDSVKIEMFQGRLYSNGILLDEAEKGLFYQRNIWKSCEILDFRGAIPTYRNVQMHKRSR